MKTEEKEIREVSNFKKVKENTSIAGKETVFNESKT
jgi:hypothetical protein